MQAEPMRGLGWFDPLTYKPEGDVDGDRRFPANRPEEIDISRKAQKARTPEGIKEAIHLGHVGNRGLWFDHADEARDELGPVDGLFAKGYLAVTMGLNSVVSKIAKHIHRQPRPFEAAEDIRYEGPKPQGSSFPSAHTSTAYAAAETMSRLSPGDTERYEHDARRVARSRVYLGAHFAGDTAAAAELGSTVASIMPYALPGAAALAGAGLLVGARASTGRAGRYMGRAGIALGALAALTGVMELRLGLFRSEKALG